MQVKASAKNIKISPEKVNLVVTQIKKMKPQDAINTLGFFNKSSSPVLKKLISSAVANAQNNNGIQAGDLVFREIIVTKGPIIKRFRATSRGRAHSIFKRTSHVTVVLESEVQQVAKKEKMEAKGDTNGPKS